MRMIAYKSGMKTPIIDYSDHLEDITILGGKFLADGMLALHCLMPGVDRIVIVPVGNFPSDLNAAMSDRQAEIQKGRDLFKVIAEPAIRRRKIQPILDCDAQTKWAMELDPE